jgi:hypothetical protein
MFPKNGCRNYAVNFPNELVKIKECKMKSGFLPCCVCRVQNFPCGEISEKTVLLSF